MKSATTIQLIIAIAAFIAAVGFGIAGFITPPPGQIHDSVLYLVAQFLLLTASIFGVGAVFTAKSNSRLNANNSISVDGKTNASDNNISNNNSKSE